jgi:uncharacterized membrane protein YphA (DoxX/SURF4 family)
MSSIVTLVGRVMFTLIFFVSGDPLHQLERVRGADARRDPVPRVLVVISALVELLGATLS